MGADSAYIQYRRPLCVAEPPQQRGEGNAGRYYSGRRKLKRRVDTTPTYPFMVVDVAALSAAAHRHSSEYARGAEPCLTTGQDIVHIIAGPISADERPINATIMDRASEKASAESDESSS